MRALALQPRLVVALGVATISVGCGGPEFELVSLDASAPLDAATTSDASPGDASPPPADGSDASTPPPKDGAAGGDASGAGDASEAGGPVVDASDGSAGDGSAAAFHCAALTGADVVFCADFDEKNMPPWNWQIELDNGMGTLAADTTDYVSPPNGFAASVPTLFTGNATLDSLATTFVSMDERIDYSFQFYVKTYGVGTTMGTASVPVAQMQIGMSGGTSLFLTLTLEGSQFHLVQSYPAGDGGTATQSTPVPGTISAKEWVHVEMLLDRNSTSPSVTVLLAGTTALQVPPAFAATDPNFQVGLGIIEVVPPVAATAFVFDNAIVRAY